MTNRTKSNLLTALDCEVIGAAKYDRFAARARIDEEWQLAKTFQLAAEECRADQLAASAGLEAVTEISFENLRTSIETEMNHIRMYTRFVREAEDEGDLCLAATFENVVQKKGERVERFQKAMESMGMHNKFEVVGIFAQR